MILDVPTFTLEHWLGRGALRALVPAAVAFHLPGAFGVMLLGRALNAAASI